MTGERGDEVAVRDLKIDGYPGLIFAIQGRGCLSCAIRDSWMHIIELTYSREISAGEVDLLAISSGYADNQDENAKRPVRVPRTIRLLRDKSTFIASHRPERG